jgi:hypothetical protein
MSWRRVNQQSHWNQEVENTHSVSRGIVQRPSKPAPRDHKCKWCGYLRSQHNPMGYRLLTSDEQKQAFGPARNVNPHLYAV